METVGKKIADIRKQKGLTQEELAESAGINLRTLQRIEKNENEPRGNTLQSLCGVLDINIENIVDYGKTENKSYIMFMYLSVLSGIVLPLGNIILPLILWLNNKDKILNVQKHGAIILNFQILYTIVSWAILGVGIYNKIMHKPYGHQFLLASVAVGFANYLYAVIVTIMISKGSTKNFYPVPVRIIK